MNPPTSEQETGGQCEKLERREKLIELPSGRVFDGDPVNPDGPEASTTIRAQAAELERLRGALETAVTACSWAEKALERYDDALGLEVDEAALIAWSKCGEVIRASDQADAAECEACAGSGKIVEAARLHGHNQHSACQMDCEDCEGTGLDPNKGRSA